MDLSPIGNPAQVLPVTADPANSAWLADNRELIRSIKSIDAAELFGEGHELAFARDQETKRAVVRVVDQQTGEVLWQAPPEYMLRLAAALGHTYG